MWLRVKQAVNGVSKSCRQLGLMLTLGRASSHTAGEMETSWLGGRGGYTENKCCQAAWEMAYYR